MGICVGTRGACGARRKNYLVMSEKGVGVRGTAHCRVFCYNKTMIYLGSDHAGYELKNKLKEFLLLEGYEVKDLGNLKYDEKDDYPDFILPVARRVVEDPEHNLGIILGGSGQGEAMAANRVKGARAAVYYGGSMDIVKFSREHNNANVLSLGARFLSEEDAKAAVKLWLATKFTGDERHVCRIKKLDT